MVCKGGQAAGVCDQYVGGQKIAFRIFTTPRTKPPPSLISSSPTGHGHQNSALSLQVVGAVQWRLDLEQQLEGDMQAKHQTKMEQMSNRVKQPNSCQVEYLSGIQVRM